MSKSWQTFFTGHRWFLFPAPHPQYFIWCEFWNWLEMKLFILVWMELNWFFNYMIGLNKLLINPEKMVQETELSTQEDSSCKHELFIRTAMLLPRGLASPIFVVS